MTVHDQISSFIDNELSHEQEQDFLISLASNEGTRKSFRSELVLKNIIHRDEVLTAPSRDMRPAVLAVIGIGAGAVAADSANAATTATVAKTGALKALFATKLNALVTSSMILASALGGYGVHSYISSNHTTPATSQRSASTLHVAPATQPIEVQAPATDNTPADLGSAPSHTSAKTLTAKKTAATKLQQNPTEPITSVGTGSVKLELPQKK